MSKNSREPTRAGSEPEIAGAGTWHGAFQRALLRDAEPAHGGPGASEGLELRPSTGVPSTVWDNVSHQEMMTAISTDANPAAVAESAREWLRVAEELVEHERALARAIDQSRGDWRGAGGDAVRRHLTAVGQWLGTTARGAQLAGRQQLLHALALEETRKRMAGNPPVEFSAEAANERLQHITDPVAYARQLAEDTRTRQAQQAAHAEAVRIMTEFDRTLAQAVVTPFFAAPPELPGVSARRPGGSGEATAVQSGHAVELGAEVTAQPGPAGTPAPIAAAFTAEPGGAPEVSGRPDAAEPGAGGPDGTAAKPGAVPPIPPPAAVPASGTPLTSRSDLPAAAGIPPGAPPDSTVASGAVPPVPPANPVAASAFGGVPPDSATASRAVPPVPPPGGFGGVPPVPPPGVVGGVPSGSKVASRGVPPIPPESTVASRAGVPPILPDSTGANRAGAVPPIPPANPVTGSAFGGVPSSRPDGKAGPGRIPPPGSTAAGGSAGRVAPSGPVPRPAGPGAVPPVPSPGAVFGGLRGGRPRGDSLRPGGPRVPEPSGAVPADDPADTPATPGVPGVPAGQQGTQAPMAGVPRAGGKPAEDEEHRVADYLEADPELFAAEQPIVPPTLGDWKKNKNWRKKP